MCFFEINFNYNKTGHLSVLYFSVDVFSDNVWVKLTIMMSNIMHMRAGVVDRNGFECLDILS